MTREVLKFHLHTESLGTEVRKNFIRNLIAAYGMPDQIILKSGGTIVEYHESEKMTSVALSELARALEAMNVVLHSLPEVVG